MIEIKNTSKKIFKMLNQVFINYKKVVNIKKISALISPNAIVFSDLSFGVIGSHCVYNKDYFQSYVVDEDREVLIPKDIIHKLIEVGFKRKDDITIKIEEKELYEIYLSCINDDTILNFDIGYIHDDLKENGVYCNRFLFGLAEQAGIGILPTAPNRPILAQILIDCTELKKLKMPYADPFTFIINEEGELKIKCSMGTSNFTKSITVMQAKKVSQMKIDMNYKYIKNIIENFDKKIWLTFYEKYMFFTVIEEGYSLMYLLSSS